MENIGTLAQIVKDRDELMSWWSNRTLRDSQSGNAYSLRVDATPSKATYCGQAYAGATNYHDAPDSFNKKLSEDLAAQAKERAAIVYEAMLANYNERIKAIRAAVEIELAAIS